MLASSALIERIRAGRWVAGADGTLAARRRRSDVTIEWIDHRHPSWEDWGSERTNAQTDGLGCYSFRRDVRHIEAIEEFPHNTQEKCGIMSRLAYPRFELHVKDFMLRHRRLLNITKSDAEVVRKMLFRQMESRIDTEGVALELPRSARLPIRSRR